MNFYQFIIPRLNGGDIERDFDCCKRLVEKGVAGFIVFGGELKTVRRGIRELQKIAERPLIIASDLERGLGQQIEGGTLFPPAMAVASAIKAGSQFPVLSSRLKLLRNTFKAIAVEANYAGINTIFAPVLDINTNPKNPIISTRAFGEDPETVSLFGVEMIEALQSNGIAACGKHFPGHGDTEVDSHISLPVVHKNLKSLEKTELLPFRNAIRAGVKMIMLGHLKVPALDKTGIPVSLSANAVKYLREKMKFKGIVITDALNMGGIGEFSEEEASAMALRAGVDILLHPADIEKVVSYLLSNPFSPPVTKVRDRLAARGKGGFLNEFRKELSHIPSKILPDFRKHGRLSEELTTKAIKISGVIKPIKQPLLVILDDDMNSNPPASPFIKGGQMRIIEKGSGRRADVRREWKGRVFAERLGEKFSDFRAQVYSSSSEIQESIPSKTSVIVAVFSSIKAWKGGASPWLLQSIKKLEDRAEVFISFGSPYLLNGIRGDTTKIYAYWDSDIAQRAVAEVF